MFLNGILFNAEVWYGLTKSDVNEFEKLDRLLLRRVLQVPVSTPQEAYYLELGIIPIGVIIKKRRLQYLHHLVKREESEMLHQFFITQWNKPTRGDWTETAKDNLEEFGLQADFGFLKSNILEIKLFLKGYLLKSIVNTTCTSHLLNLLHLPTWEYYIRGWYH